MSFLIKIGKKNNHLLHSNSNNTIHSQRKDKNIINIQTRDTNYRYFWPNFILGQNERPWPISLQILLHSGTLKKIFPKCRYLKTSQARVKRRVNTCKRRLKQMYVQRISIWCFCFHERFYVTTMKNIHSTSKNIP